MDEPGFVEIPIAFHRAGCIFPRPVLSCSGFVVRSERAEKRTMFSQRRPAQIGLASACLLLIVTRTTLYRGSHEASLRDRERNGDGMSVSRLSGGIRMPGVAMK